MAKNIRKGTEVIYFLLFGIFVYLFTRKTEKMIQVVREDVENETTYGKLYVNGIYVCDTLEDVERENKIPAITAIPAGKYRVLYNWSPKFKRNMLLITGVPNFSGIRFHGGSNNTHTHGCVILGEKRENGFFPKNNDKRWYLKFNDEIGAHINAGNHVYINIHSVKS
jgi:hypothetical protein